MCFASERIRDRRCSSSRAGFVRRKGVAVLAEALPLILNAAPDARDSHRRQRPDGRRVASRGARRMTDRVRFLGTIPPSDLAREYATARAVLVPSIWKENFALVGLEAMSSAHAGRGVGSGRHTRVAAT